MRTPYREATPTSGQPAPSGEELWVARRIEATGELSILPHFVQARSWYDARALFQKKLGLTTDPRIVTEDELKIARAWTRWKVHRPTPVPSCKGSKSRV